jgi:GT2 family glycosyltransferase
MIDAPLVHVLVINWNGKQHLEECFSTLLAGDYQNARYVLVDNASEDGSVDYVRQRFPDPRIEALVCSRNLGWGGGNNAGIERAVKAGAKYVFLLNNDTAMAPDAVTKLVQMAEADPVLGALAPRMVLYGSPELLNSTGLECTLIGSSWDSGLGRLDGPKWHDARPVLGACGGACFLRISALEKTGLLPGEFGIYYDDLDLCLRIWNAGYVIRRCPEAVVRHKFGATMQEGPRRRRYYGLNQRNRLRMVLRNFPILTRPYVLPSLIIGECRAVGRAFLDREWWRVGVHVRSWGDALIYLPKAIAERAHRLRKGLFRCRFWSLIRKDMMFYPGVELPVDGWYRPRKMAGLEVRPISVRAYSRTGGGRLRLTLINCYPDLGSARITLRINGTPRAHLETLDRAETVVVLPAGLIEIEAHAIFEAEETGESADYGGWISLASA